MTATMLATLLAIALNAPAQGPAARNDRDRCPRDVDAAFAALDRSLRSLGDDVDRVGNERDRKKLRDDLNGAIRASERARNEACDAAGGRSDSPIIVVPAPAPVPEPRVLSAAGFNELLGTVKKESFDDGRLRVLRAAMVGDICVTTDQLKALMAVPAFATGKVDVARIAFPRIIDVERVYLLNEVLTFASDKADMAAFQNTAGTHPACRLPRR